MSVFVSIATVGFILLAMVGLGGPIVSRLGRGLTANEKIVFSILVGALPLAGAVWLVGAIAYNTISMLALLGALILSLLPALARFSHTFLASINFRELSITPITTRVLFLIILIVMGIAVISSFAPPSEHDTIRYHLTLPKRDLEFGRIAVHFGWSVYEFFPPLAGLLARLSFALGGESASQLLNVSFGAVTAATTGLLATRLGGSNTVAMAAALIYLLHRVVINLMPGFTDDIILSGFITAGVCLLIVLWEHQSADVKVSLLLGLILGGILNIKYFGFVVVALMLAGAAVIWFSKRRQLTPLVVAGLTALVLVSPVLIRNAVIAGNPVFPLLNAYFIQDGVDIFGVFSETMEQRINVPGGFLFAPLTIFILQSEFDGLQYGFPLVLIALPFAFCRHRFRPKRVAALALILGFMLSWWFLMPQLLRFTQPILGIASALAAIGLGTIAWNTGRQSWSRAAFAVFLGIAVMTQTLFLGSSALYRLPAAMGHVSESEFLGKNIFKYYTLARSCKWLTERLNPGERYLALVNDPSFYCPQLATMPVLELDEVDSYYSVSQAPLLTDYELARRMESYNVRYVLVASNIGADSDPLVFAKHRFDRQVISVIDQKSQIFESEVGAVYEGRRIISALRTEHSLEFGF